MPPQLAVCVLNAHLPFEQPSELERPEVDVPPAIVDLLKADLLAGASKTDIHPRAVPADAAVVAHIPLLEVRRVLQRREPFREGSRRRRVDARRSPHPAGFVRPLLVVFLAEAVAAALLRAAARAREGAWSRL